ncbi:L-lactate permease [Pseudobacteroides cellulosolvens]
MSELLLTLLPIVVLLVMLVGLKKPADISGIVGWLVVSVVAVLFFKTSFEVIARSTAAGFIRSFTVSLVVAASMLQMAYMEKTGALKRVVIFLKTIAADNKAVQIMIINIGFGTLMVAVGATPGSVLPPIMMAIGYSAFISIALPSIGYDSLCTYALLGAPLVVFVDTVNQFLGKGHEVTLSQVGSIFFMFLPVVSTLIGFSMLWIVGKWKAIKEGWLPCAISGLVITIVSYFTNKVDRLVVLTGIFCGVAVIAAMIIYLVATGKKVIDKSKLTRDELEYEKSFPLWKALAPWGLLIILILALNIPKESFEFLYKTHPVPIEGIAANGKPILTRALWNAYTWIFVSIFLSMLILRPKASQVKEAFVVWKKRAPRPVFAAAIFFVIGEIMNTAGFNMVTKKFETESMVQVLANFSAKTFESIYGGVVGFVGLLGGFITGSEASTIGMFGNYALKTAQGLNMDLNSLLIIGAGLAFGGGLASVISPAKLQNAAASIDRMGEETKVIRTAFVFALILTTISSALVMIILKTGIVK